MKTFTYSYLVLLCFANISCKDKVKVGSKVDITETGRKETAVEVVESQDMTKEFFGEQFKKIEAEEAAASANKELLPSDDKNETPDE
ncbi:hypothetical protein ACFSW8_02660 [Rubritalea tangerina]|uniref:Uncharacterized protein n=1 Tax=Rubritalea tangerina TaxID=430798 RepID=A0ABW4Z7S0_9BACT